MVLKVQSNPVCVGDTEQGIISPFIYKIELSSLNTLTIRIDNKNNNTNSSQRDHLTAWNKTYRTRYHFILKVALLKCHLSRAMSLQIHKTECGKLCGFMKRTCSDSWCLWQHFTCWHIARAKASAYFWQNSTLPFAEIPEGSCTQIIDTETLNWAQLWQKHSHFPTVTFIPPFIMDSKRLPKPLRTENMLACVMRGRCLSFHREELDAMVRVFLSDMVSWEA